jgi:hypothetical protein
MRLQDEVFCAAMRRSRDWKRQGRPEGVITAAQTDSRILNRVQGVSFIPRGSSLDNF